MQFRPSDPGTVGMELELQLIDRRTMDLADGILPLMELCAGNPYVKPEFIQNTVEIASKVCRSLPELDHHVRALAREIAGNCEKLGLALCGAGSHPFGQRLALFTPMPRYLEMEQATGYLGHTQITFATHVHIGMSSGAEAVRVMRDLKPFLPLLLAISASSPFWRGYDTGFASYRHRILAATRSYGIPPSFPDWESFSAFLETAFKAGIFPTINDIHWDIRPRPHLGSLEVRVMDAQPTVSEAIALAGFVRVLVDYLRHTPESERLPGLPAPLPWWFEKHNHYQASQLGLEASILANEEGGLRSLRALFEDLVEAVTPTAERLGQTPELRRLIETVSTGVSYLRQREIQRRSGSYNRVVEALVEELATDWGRT